MHLCASKNIASKYIKQNELQEKDKLIIRLQKFHLLIHTGTESDKSSRRNISKVIVNFEEQNFVCLFWLCCVYVESSFPARDQTVTQIGSTKS